MMKISFSNSLSQIKESFFINIQYGCDQAKAILLKTALFVKKFFEKLTQIIGKSQEFSLSETRKNLNHQELAQVKSQIFRGEFSQNEAQNALNLYSGEAHFVIVIEMISQKKYEQLPIFLKSHELRTYLSSKDRSSVLLKRARPLIQQITNTQLQKQLNELLTIETK